jgi:serine protease AprX
VAKKRKTPTGRKPKKSIAKRRREAVTEQADLRRMDERTRREELRIDMLRSVVTEPLLSKVKEKAGDSYDVIISLNELYEGGIAGALKVVEQLATEWKVKYEKVSHYVFACLSGDRILWLASETHKQIESAAGRRADPRTASIIYRIWEDNDIHVSLTRSLVTVKADAAQRAFQARGNGIVWAILDSGIAGGHPHFKRQESPFGPIDSLRLAKPVEHRDYTPDGKARSASAPTPPETALEDELGHGTHVAGIIAGYWEASDPKGEPVAGSEMRNEGDEGSNAKPFKRRENIRTISAVAPKCTLVSMKVIADRDGTPDAKQNKAQGKVSWVLLAIDQIQQWNQNGKRLLVHGVNMSLGYDFDPRWFACGESPICVEVNRLVKSGVAVVVSAGNGGYTAFVTANQKVLAQYNSLTITDPGNADLAITVGSTHKEMPHRYGVSYFSSRGPTGDGRQKPDLLAPGERIISCAAGDEARKYAETDQDGKPLPDVLYCEQSGTSMAAPHVSGAVAAFLSVRTEFIGQPERVKDLFMETAVDLKRERSFQGAGLLDLMKALQAI